MIQTIILRRLSVYGSTLFFCRFSIFNPFCRNSLLTLLWPPLTLSIVSTVYTIWTFISLLLSFLFSHPLLLPSPLFPFFLLPSFFPFFFPIFLPSFLPFLLRSFLILSIWCHVKILSKLFGYSSEVRFLRVLYLGRRTSLTGRNHKDVENH